MVFDLNFTSHSLYSYSSTNTNARTQVLNAMIQLYKKMYNKVEDIDLCSEWSHVRNVTLSYINTHYHTKSTHRSNKLR